MNDSTPNEFNSINITDDAVVYVGQFIRRGNAHPHNARENNYFCSFEITGDIRFLSRYWNHRENRKYTFKLSLLDAKAAMYYFAMYLRGALVPSLASLWSFMASAPVEVSWESETHFLKGETLFMLPIETAKELFEKLPDAIAQAEAMLREDMAHESE